MAPPLPIPEGMAKAELDAMLVSKEWRIEESFRCFFCSQPAYLHPYTNKIWGCIHCNNTTYEVAINFRPSEIVA